MSKIGFLKDVFRSITLRHKYSCTYNVGSYTTNLYYESLDGYPSAYDYANNFISDREVSTVQISEQFSPLIGLDVIMQNSFTANVQIRKTRTMTMSFTNNQLTDNSSDEYVFGVGYRFKDVKFTVRSVGGRGKKTDLKSDINLKLDFSIRNSLTVLRRLDEDINQISAGQDIYSINVSADYMVSRNLTIAFYYDQTINDPKLSTSVYNSTLSAGISLRMTLSE